MDREASVFGAQRVGFSRARGRWGGVAAHLPGRLLSTANEEGIVGRHVGAAAEQTEHAAGDARGEGANLSRARGRLRLERCRHRVRPLPEDAIGDEEVQVMPGAQAVGEPLDPAHRGRAGDAQGGIGRGAGALKLRDGTGAQARNSRGEICVKAQTDRQRGRKRHHDLAPADRRVEHPIDQPGSALGHRSAAAGRTDRALAGEREYAVLLAAVTPQTNKTPSVVATGRHRHEVVDDERG